jgi:alpha-glucosidase
MADLSASDWRRGGVIYQIYPRSFLDTNGDGIGDLEGIAAKLPYIARLEVDGVWLCPFYPSPMADFGYDVSDYRDVDPMFGTLEDFKRLLSSAHDAGLKVIVDQVYSHTSDHHPWFAESRASREGPKADWYVWADPKPDGTPVNNWLSVFGGPGWTWDARRRQHYMHSFLAEQPQLNFHNSEVRRAILDVAKFWLELGVDGFRLDVANHYFHDAALTDNPAKAPRAPHRPYSYQRHLHDRSRPETVGFLKQLRALVDRYPGAMTVAEVFSEAYVGRLVEYTRGNDLLHTAYGFWFLEDRPLSGELVRDALEPWSTVDAWPSWSFSNHDVVRAVTRWGGGNADPGADRRLAKLLVTLLLCLRGTIFLYQGEELGLPQAEVPFAKLKDPEGIRFWPRSLGRDGCRTPMPWTAGAANAGFSSAAETWLPVDPRHAGLAVDRQEADADSVLRHTRAMIALRRSSPALHAGSIAFRIADGAALAFSRAVDGATIHCLFNLGKAPLTLAAGFAAGGEAIGPGLGGRLEGGEAELAPHGALLLSSRA